MPDLIRHPCKSRHQRWIPVSSTGMTEKRTFPVLVRLFFSSHGELGQDLSCFTTQVIPGKLQHLVRLIGKNPDLSIYAEKLTGNT